MYPALSAAALLCFTLANLLTSYLYLYPVVHQCGFAVPSAYSTGHNSSEAPDNAPFRLLVLADPQLEGDSSLPNGTVRPTLTQLLTSLLPWSAGTEAGTAEGSLQRVQLSKLVAGTIQYYRKRLDLFGNDYYLAHIYRTVSQYTKPTHVTVLGDLIGSQWVSNDEWQRRADRFWGRVFGNAHKIEDDIAAAWRTDAPSSNELDESGAVDAWQARIMNVAGNHDIGYAGDIRKANVERFERSFGPVNWATRFALPVPQEQEGEQQPPELRVVVLNSLNLDSPVLDSDVQGDTYAFINTVIDGARPVGDHKSATILLTHLPLYKDDGVCTDGPMISYYSSESGGGLREQNHLSYGASKTVLESLFGMSANQDAPANGFGRPGIILTGHDHTGCDVLHHLPRRDQSTDTTDNNNDDDKSRWRAMRLNASTALRAAQWQRDNLAPSIREVTVRSMMGDFGGNAGLLSAWFDKSQQRWQFEYSTCAIGKQHLWWAVHVFDLVTVFIVGWALADAFLLAPTPEKDKKLKKS